MANFTFKDQTNDYFHMTLSNNKPAQHQAVLQRENSTVSRANIAGIRSRLRYDASGGAGSSVSSSTAVGSDGEGPRGTSTKRQEPPPPTAAFASAHAAADRSFRTEAEAAAFSPLRHHPPPSNAAPDSIDNSSSLTAPSLSPIRFLGSGGRAQPSPMVPPYRLSARQHQTASAFCADSNLLARRNLTLPARLRVRHCRAHGPEQIVNDRSRTSRTDAGQTGSGHLAGDRCRLGASRCTPEDGCALTTSSTPTSTTSLPAATWLSHRPRQQGL